MPRITSLNMLLENEGKDYLAELYGRVIQNLQKALVSSGMKNAELSGNPEAGSMEAKRFANATSKDYGTARAAGKGDAVKAKPVTVALDKDKEIVEELEEKDIKLYGVELFYHYGTKTVTPDLIFRPGVFNKAESYKAGTQYYTRANGSTPRWRSAALPLARTTTPWNKEGQSMLYRNIKTGNIISPASKEAGEIMAKSSLYEPVRPIRMEEPPKEPPQEPPKEPDPPKEPKAPKSK